MNNPHDPYEIPSSPQGLRSAIGEAGPSVLKEPHAIDQFIKRITVVTDTLNGIRAKVENITERLIGAGPEVPDSPRPPAPEGYGQYGKLSAALDTLCLEVEHLNDRVMLMKDQL